MLDLHKNQGPVVQTLYRAIHRTEITIQRILLRWIVICPLDSAIQRLNNLDGGFIFATLNALKRNRSLSKGLMVSICSKDFTAANFPFVNVAAIFKRKFMTFY